MRSEFKPARGAGDDGFTDLLLGRRVRKTDIRVKTNALIDELSCLLGLIKAGGTRKAELARAQLALSAACAGIAGMKNGTALRREISLLEADTAGLARKIKPPRKFVLPGGGRAEALLHLARAKTRVCEILCWETKAKEPAIYLNRLSDWLFLLALSAKKKRNGR